MKRLISLVVCLLIAFPAFGQECEFSVTKLETGQESPCEGFLFSRNKELEVRQQVMDYEQLQEQQKLYIQQIDLHKQEAELSQKEADKQEEKVKLWQDRAEEITLKYTEAQDNRGYRDLFFLVGGVLLTVGAGFAVGAASAK